MSSKAEYAAKLKDPRWQKLRLQALDRDGWACRVCGTNTETLHAHHSFYDWGADPWDYPPATIITVCDDCHNMEHANWGCDGLHRTLCANGYWSLYQRDFLASAFHIPGQRPLTDIEAQAMTLVIEWFSGLVRTEGIGPGSAVSVICELGRKTSKMPNMNFAEGGHG